MERERSVLDSRNSVVEAEQLLATLNTVSVQNDPWLPAGRVRAGVHRLPARSEVRSEENGAATLGAARGRIDLLPCEVKHVQFLREPAHQCHRSVAHLVDLILTHDDFGIPTLTVHEVRMRI